MTTAKDHERVIQRSKQQEKVLALLAAKWKQYPQLRLCQLIGNAIPTQAKDTYYLADNELEALLKAYNP